MVTTRSSKTKQTTKATKAPAGREAANLTIDGTENLCGSRTTRKIVRTETIGRRTWDYLASDVASDTEDDPIRRKRKRDESTDPDETFLEAAKVQLKRTKTDCNGNEEILRFLHHITLPSSRRIRHEYPGGRLAAGETEAYVLSEQDARRLLASSESITAPVFVLGGSTSANGVVETKSGRRPIEQIFDWYPNDADKFDGRVGVKQVTKSVAELRKCFLAVKSSGPLWNFPDLVWPATMPTPAFLNQPSCNLLTNVMRYLVNTPEIDICTDACTRRGPPGRTCREHTLTMAEYDDVQNYWPFWQGGVMMAEAGAVTKCHNDQWGLGTHITILKGETGFGYLPNPTKEDLKDASAIKPDGRWRYKVLRPGDTLYMGPGTPHLVFRLPEGKQTLGLASHLVRGVDAERWVEVIRAYVQLTADDILYVAGWPRMLLALTLGLRYAHDGLMSQKGRQAVYGGQEQIARFDRALKELEQFAKDLPVD